MYVPSPHLVQHTAQWGKTNKVTAKPLYRAVAHVSLRKLLCNAACLRSVHPALSSDKAAFSNTDQFKIGITDAGFEVPFFDRSEATVLTAARLSLANTGKKGRAKFSFCDWDADTAGPGFCQLILMLNVEDASHQ